MRLLAILIALGLVFLHGSVFGQNLESQFVSAINQLRSSGCKCGNKNFPPAKPLKSNELLTESAFIHAREIRHRQKLSHYSWSGLNIGERISRTRYKWSVVGENLAFGQRSISEVLNDWIESDVHCRLLMDDRFNEMGLSKVGDYWVLHFGSQKSNKS